MPNLFQPRNADELRDQFLRDIRLAAIDAGEDAPPVEPGTDWYGLATAVGNISLLGFANIASAEDDMSASSATGAALDRIRKDLGLPEVPAVGASGKIVVRVAGLVTIPDGLEFVYPNGLRGVVVGTYVNPADMAEVDARASDVGIKTDLPSDQVVRFRSPPVNLGSEAKVSKGAPLTGGADVESNERKRDRILNVLQNKPAGKNADSNWAKIRRDVLDSLGSVQDCYVYPALGGPSSCKIVPVKDVNPSTNDFSRALSSVALDTIRAYLHTTLGIPQENVVQTVANQAVDVSILLDLPDASGAGGSGLGWTDPYPWPALVPADANRVTVSTASSADTITVTANTAATPVAGQTHVAWWSPTDRLFYTALVTAVSGSPGAVVLTLDRPLVGKTGVGPTTGDFISPAAHNLDKYGAEWIAQMRALGPGENTADSNRLPRALRHPFTTIEDPCGITNAVLASLARKFEEISDYAYGYRSVTTPTVPASVATAPSILVPRHFAIYPVS